MARRFGDIPHPIPKGDAQRFMNRIVKRPDEGDCWELDWLSSGDLRVFSYKNHSVAGQARAAHRVAWSIFRGPTPADLEVCHRCENKACINPDHLFLGTRSANAKDAIDCKSAFGSLTDSERIDVGTLIAFGAAASTVAAEFGISIGRARHLSNSALGRGPSMSCAPRTWWF